MVSEMGRFRLECGSAFGSAALVSLCWLLFLAGTAAPDKQERQSKALPHSIPDSPPALDDDWEPPEKLSAFGLFRDAATQQPAKGVMPYDVNTPLFSDYTAKYRFVKLPPGGR